MTPGVQPSFPSETRLVSAIVAIPRKRALGDRLKTSQYPLWENIFRAKPGSLETMKMLADVSKGKAFYASISYEIARHHLLNGDAGLARAQLNDTWNTTPVLLAKATAAEMAGSFTEAFTLFEEALKRVPLGWKYDEIESSLMRIAGKMCAKEHIQLEEIAYLTLRTSPEKLFVTSPALIGVCYLKGFGVEINEVKAFTLFCQASSVGCLKGKFYQAYCLLTGLGTNKDVHTAIRLLKEGHEAGSLAATTTLGECYLMGAGFKKPLPRTGRRLIQLAAQSEYPHAVKLWRNYQKNPSMKGVPALH